MVWVFWVCRASFNKIVVFLLCVCVWFVFLLCAALLVSSLLFKWNIPYGYIFFGCSVVFFFFRRISFNRTPMNLGNCLVFVILLCFQFPNLDIRAKRHVPSRYYLQWFIEQCLLWSYLNWTLTPFLPVSVIEPERIVKKWE